MMTMLDTHDAIHHQPQKMGLPCEKISKIGFFVDKKFLSNINKRK